MQRQAQLSQTLRRVMAEFMVSMVNAWRVLTICLSPAILRQQAVHVDPRTGRLLHARRRR
jgi:hypothetical protein